MAGRLFTSESVTEGHPDKIADQISDSVLDAMLEQDPHSRVAVETLLTTGLVVVAGEVTTTGYVDIKQKVRDRILEIGYDSSEKGFDGHSCGVMVAIGGQSGDIAQGVDTGHESRTGSVDAMDKQGAGDQGLMFGYACDDTDVLMPLPIVIAQRLAEQLTAVRKDGTLPYLRPDGKTQVTIEYDADNRPVRVDTVVLSSQHSEEVELDTLESDVKKHVIDPILAEFALPSEGYRLLVNPTGRFVVGGPMGDAGLTGRKIIVDTYGGMARHGGGAFSGKDPSKVDRSAAYAMRWVAKNVVAAGLARRCEVQVAYAIGKAQPVGVFIETFGTGVIPDEKIQEAVLARLRPAPGRDHRRPRPAPPDLRQDRGVRALRPRAARVHLGAHRPRRRAEGRRGHLTDRTLLGRTRDAVRGPRLACVQTVEETGSHASWPTRRSSALSAVVLAGVVLVGCPAGRSSPPRHRSTAPSPRTGWPRTRRGGVRADPRDRRARWTSPASAAGAEVANPAVSATTSVRAAADAHLARYGAAFGLERPGHVRGVRRPLGHRVAPGRRALRPGASAACP